MVDKVELTRKFGHREEIRVLTFQALAVCRSEDEGLRVA